jgi:hypothetical protein
MAGIVADIPDFAVIGWRWIQPTPISYDPKAKVLHLGANFVRVPQLVRSGTCHANRKPKSDDAYLYAWHVDTSSIPATLYSSDGTTWHEIRGGAGD